LWFKFLTFIIISFVFQGQLVEFKEREREREEERGRERERERDRERPLNVNEVYVWKKKNSSE
jgi:hypothetical protein